ncbi:iron chelate uptake ABC transporter family permease subunit [Nocardioides humi]|uniref:iron chelate uptake ABC transporter family permease subunit n=1 Tax=Nocardioides humi TaxID=449461 RepID=UPI0015E85609|nr:iron chelate uptake ABC transporter family permease subunit [Nocardioides humi]
MVTPRYLLVCLTLVVLALVAGVAAVLVGEVQMSMSRLWVTIHGDGNTLEQYLVFDSRLPRVVGAVVVGAALGLSGSIFQTVSRNPLGSPDVIGFETGASTGGLIALLVLGTGFAGPRSAPSPAGWRPRSSSTASP